MGRFRVAYVQTWTLDPHQWTWTSSPRLDIGSLLDLGSNFGSFGLNVVILRIKHDLKSSNFWDLVESSDFC